MIESDDDERRKRGIRGMARIGKVERKERLGRKRSARRKRRRRWASKAAGPRYRWVLAKIVDLVAEVQEAQDSSRDFSVGHLRNHLRGRVSRFLLRSFGRSILIRERHSSQPRKQGSRVPCLAGRRENHQPRNLAEGQGEEGISSVR